MSSCSASIGPKQASWLLVDIMLAMIWLWQFGVKDLPVVNECFWTGFGLVNNSLVVASAALVSRYCS